MGATSGKTEKFDLAIAGGGIAGLTLALLLADAGLTIAVIEPAPPVNAPAHGARSSRTVALQEASINVLRATGVWERMEDSATPLRTMRLIDDSMRGQPRIQAEFHATEIGRTRFGCNIPNDGLRAALYEMASAHKGIGWYQSPLERFTAEDRNVLVKMVDGRCLQSPLLIGADGRKSRVRELAGIKARVKAHGQTAITCVIAHAHSHNFTSTEFHRPSGPFALVPMPGNHSAIVWVEKTTDAEEIMRLRRQDFTTLLEKNTCGILGAVTLESSPESWPLQTLWIKDLTGPRLALMAEAAHVMPPIAAQGLNLSLRDTAALAETLIGAARAGIDIGSQSVLRGYAARRRGDIDSRLLGVAAMNGLVAAEAGLIKHARRGGLKALDYLKPIKRIAMRAALAPSTDEGRLLAGGPL